MRYPTVHVGGTPPQRLLEDYTEAVNRLTAALAALEWAAPNARDYPQCGQWSHAVTEHNRRIADVARILLDVRKLAEHVADQPKARTP